MRDDRECMGDYYYFYVCFTEKHVNLTNWYPYFTRISPDIP